MTASASSSASASASRQITVNYTLHPPTSIDPSTVTHNDKPVPTSQISTYPITTSSSDSSATSNYYNALAPTLKTVQVELMENLSAWKESIGDLEKMKEDPGTPGFGRGKAAIMSEGVMDPEEEEEDSEDEDEDVGEVDAGQ
jgi:hypothetical protein